MYSYQRTTAVLPAAQVLFGKLKVSLDDIMGDKSPWDHGVIVIVRRFDGKFYFVAGSGDSRYYATDACFNAHHDQSGRPLFGGFVFNEVVWSRKDGVLKHEFVDQDPARKPPLTFRAPMGVFK